MSTTPDPSRRSFLLTTTATGLLLAGCQLPQKSATPDADENDEKVTPGEDLMQEHGILKRILLVYGEALRRIDAHEDLPPDPLKRAATLIRTFVEEYHEQQEEQFLFPRMRQANKLVDLIDTLLVQHKAGRQVTDQIISLSTVQTLRDPAQTHLLADRMQQFIRMYSAHEAREDTVLFPAFRELLSKHEYDALGEQFEANEKKHFGADGFDLAVDQITQIEKEYNLYDLAQYTPKL